MYAEAAIPPQTLSSTTSAAPAAGQQKPKLLDRGRGVLRTRQYSHRTEQSHCQWACLPRHEASRRRQVKRFISFHQVWHPAQMDEPESNAFLTHLAIRGNVSASTQNHALSALLFLYRQMLDRSFGDIGAIVRARRPSRLPMVLTRQEVKALLGEFGRDRWRLASLMYGGRLHLMECLRLRVQHVGLAAGQIIVRDGKGSKDRVTMLPESVKTTLREHLRLAKIIHEQNVADGRGRVEMPYALDWK